MFDLRDVLRGLRRDAGYGAIVALTLALTIGATTAVFSIVNGVLLKPLAYRESHQLVSIREIYRQFEQQYPTLPVNARHFDQWRRRAQTFDSLAEFIVQSANLTGGGTPRQVVIVRAAGRLFDVMSVRPPLGRALTVDDEREGAADVVVISDALWRERFGADVSAVGRAAVLDGRPYTIAGVLPRGFRLPETAMVMSSAMTLSANVDAIVPLRPKLDEVSWAGEFNYTVLGRLRHGASLEQAAAELNVIQADVSAAATQATHEPTTVAASVLPLDTAVVGGARRALLLLLGAIGAVLLIACSNLANLSLTRTIDRLRDAAIRVALGASRERLLGRVVQEQLVLAATGGALGMIVAYAALVIFVRTAPIGLPRVDEVTIDPRAVAFGVAVALITGLLIAILPAWRVASRDVQDALRSAAWGTTGDRGGRRARSMLVAAQVALSVTLLVVTTLLGISFFRLLHVDRGFASDRVLTASIAFPASRYDTAPARIDAYDRTLAAIHALPGVEAATWMSLLPTRGDGWVDLIVAHGDTRPTFERPTANYRVVAPEFFKVTGMTILKGRSFSGLERDPHLPTPALVSARAAAIAWPGRDAVGQRFTRGDGAVQPFEVVGVVADARVTGLDRTPPLVVYVPYWARSAPKASVMVRTAAAPSTFADELRRAVATVDPDTAVADVQTLDEVVDASVATRRYQVELFVAFGLAALAIAIVGVYGVTAYGVLRRRREMNIRVALGARGSQVIALILREGLVPIVGGAAAGTAGALALSGVLGSLLFGVSGRDPWVMTGVVAVVTGAALAACLVAVRQSLVIDPAIALREE